MNSQSKGRNGKIYLRTILFGYIRVLHSAAQVCCFDRGLLRSCFAEWTKYAPVVYPQRLVTGTPVSPYSDMLLPISRLSPICCFLSPWGHACCLLVCGMSDGPKVQGFTQAATRQGAQKHHGWFAAGLANKIVAFRAEMRRRDVAHNRRRQQTGRQTHKKNTRTR